MKQIVISSGLHLNEESKKVGWNKRSVSGLDARVENGQRAYPGLRQPVCPLVQMKTAVVKVDADPALIADRPS